MPLTLFRSSRFAFLLLALVTLCPNAIAQWTGTNTPRLRNQCVWFTTETKGFIGSADTSGNDLDTTLRVTTNGGASYSFQVDETENPLEFWDIHFLNANLGYATHLANGSIYKTTNGGNSWVEVGQAGVALNNYTLWFTSATTGYVVQCGANDEAYIYKTTDGGANWSHNEVEYVSLNDIHFPTPSIGYTVGANGTVLKTTNAGASWVPSATGRSEFLMGVWFTSADTGIAVGENGLILRTVNGGGSWVKIASGTTQRLNAVMFATRSLGYAVGNGGVILTTQNGGATWTAEQSGTTQMLRDVHFPTPTTGYAVGENIILKCSSSGR